MFRGKLKKKKKVELKPQMNTLKSPMETTGSCTDSNYILAYQYENTHSRAN